MIDPAQIARLVQPIGERHGLTPVETMRLTKLVTDVAPRYSERNGGYLRILKLGPRQGDNAPMARVELV